MQNSLSTATGTYLTWYFHLHPAAAVSSLCADLNLYSSSALPALSTSLPLLFIGNQFHPPRTMKSIIKQQALPRRRS